MLLEKIFKKTSKILAGHGFGNNPKLAKIYQKIGKTVLPEFIEYDGHKIFLESEDSINIATFGYEHEKFELNLFKGSLKKGDIVLDIGANIGLYSLSAAKIVGDSGKIYSFEPDPITFKNLKKNIESNKFNNVELINKAVSNKTGTIGFTSSENISSRSKNHIKLDNESDTNSIKIPTIKIDDFFENRNIEINIIKMDIEGAEFEALKGMKKIIDKNKHLKIFLEFSPFMLKRLNTDIVEMMNFFKYYNFKINKINEQENKLEEISSEWLLEFAVEDDPTKGLNLYCFR